MTPELPRVARIVARFIPAGDRDWILGDVIEDAEGRGLRGAKRGWWIALECISIAAGLSAQRARTWLVLPPVRELTAGLAVDGRVALRGSGSGTLVRALLFCGSIAMLALGVAVLVSTLLVAAGF